MYIDIYIFNNDFAFFYSFKGIFRELGRKRTENSE